MSEYRNNVANEVSGTPGTGTITLGAAVTGAQSFSAAYGANATVDVFITDGAAWEVARNCTYTHSGTTLTRGTLEASSTGSALSLTSAAVVRVALPAEVANALDRQISKGCVIVTADGSTTQSIAATTFTKVSTVLTTVLQDQKSWWDTSNKRFTPQRAGLYSVSGGVSIAIVDANATVIVLLYKNGAENRMLFRGYSSDANSTNQVSGTALVELNGSTDYIELYCYHSSAAAKSTEAIAGRTFFNAHFVADL